MRVTPTHRPKGKARETDKGHLTNEMVIQSDLHI
jgi:hypothetical protein